MLFLGKIICVEFLFLLKILIPTIDKHKVLTKQTFQWGHCLQKYKLSSKLH